MKLEIPKENDFNFAFINSIQKVEFEGTKTINHNDLSDFCRNFYPFVSLVIEPRKRTSSTGKISTSSKYGTYLRYKRVSKFENEAKVKHRIIHFIKNSPVEDEINNVLSNSFGFGGTNVSLVFSKFRE